MIEVALFGEDIGHKEVVGALVARVASEEKLATSLKWRSDTGGVPTVLGKLNRYVRDLERQGDPPDLLVVAVDSNREGHGTRAQQVAKHQSPTPTVLAIPDPHVERWLLLDGEAFKKVLGHGCSAPDQKCEKNRYKQVLASQMARAGIEPLLGGLEYAKDLIEAMNLQRAMAVDKSIKHFLTDLRRELRNVSQRK